MMHVFYQHILYEYQICAMGGLLKYLEKMRIGIELEEAGAQLPVLDVKIVTL